MTNEQQKSMNVKVINTNELIFDPDPESRDTLRPAFSEEGVDLTLIRWMLGLSPLERLRAIQSYAASAYRLRHAARQVRL